MILCIGLTPTVQRTMFFDRLEVGAVNRARETLITASGKGVNVARVLSTLGAHVHLVQPLGGDPGRFVAQALEQEGVQGETVWLDEDAPTRTCTTLLQTDGTTTELVEEARCVPPPAVEKLEAAWKNALPGAKAVCCSGSFPRGVPDDLYARVVAAAQVRGIPAIVDAQRGPLKAALAESPFLVKPNREEAAATLGLNLTGRADRDARTAVRALTEAGAAWALVSMGAEGALLGCRKTGELWRITPPRVQAVNPIGSGDSLAAGIMYGMIEMGLTVPEAVAYGTACAAANCLTPTSGVVHAADVARFKPLVGLTPTH